MNLNEFPEPSERYLLEECLGTGAFGRGYEATDSQASDKKVAIKIQKISQDSQRHIEQEYKVLRKLSWHANLLEFYGIYRKGNEIWFSLEVCKGHCVLELVQNLLAQNRRMREEHIAYILSETVKACIFLHKNCYIHRDIKCKNIFLTQDGEVKLGDFGFACILKDPLDTTNECMGSPCWMAPEIITCKRNKKPYGNRADVWSLGITAIELGDGEAPYQSMHPTRILFQVVVNPAPTLRRKFNWLGNYVDFINECLVKNPEHRPYMAELASHPFLEQIPENNYHFTLEIKTLLCEMELVPVIDPNFVEVAVIEEFVKHGVDGNFEKMLLEDLASLQSVNEGQIIELLKARAKTGLYQTFVGDILIVLNPNENQDIYGEKFHQKYHNKSLSENSPHIYTIADSAYQHSLHHNIPQKIILTGESGSGKTTNFLHLIDHLLFLGQNKNVNLVRIKSAIKLIQLMTHSSTPMNNFSTRCVFKTDIKFGCTGKISGAIFNVLHLEKWRISSADIFQGTFYFLHCLFEGLRENKKLEEYLLHPGFVYKYLKSGVTSTNDDEKNLQNFKMILKTFEDFNVSSEETDTIFSIFAAILILGEIFFEYSDEDVLKNKDQENIKKIAQLLHVDLHKLQWAFTNYCLTKNGVVIKRRNTVEEAKCIRDVLVNNLYSRLVDYIIFFINNSLTTGRKIFGDNYSIQIIDYFGFECFKTNYLSQLFVNCFNEQIHYYYTQKTFYWEYLDMKDEGLEFNESFTYYDNKTCLDELLSKTESVFSIIDEASIMNYNDKYVTNFIQKSEKKFVQTVERLEFSVAHYTGRVMYNAKNISEKNRDYLSPEIIEVFRSSNNSIVELLFKSKLDKAGNLVIPVDGERNLEKATTCVRKFRAVSLKIFKDLLKGSTHFVCCIKTDIKQKPNSFNSELVRQQIQALEITETAKIRQRGYSHRISFHEFLRRYKFLAFDFDENVEINRENCRLLLIRLGMEDWSVGKSLVFLKYYNEEYLARLYDTQVRKIVKIQSILRGFLAKCLVAKQKETKLCHLFQEPKQEKLSKEEAAIIIQKAYRHSLAKTSSQDEDDFRILDEKICEFIKRNLFKWRKKTIFHVLLLYKCVRFQDCFNFSQQVHLFNIGAVYELQEINDKISLDDINLEATTFSWLGECSVTVRKIPFRLHEIPFLDSSEMLDSVLNYELAEEKNDVWDTPYSRRNLFYSNACNNKATQNKELTIVPFNRDSESFSEENKAKRVDKNRLPSKEVLPKTDTQKKLKDFKESEIKAKSFSTKTEDNVNFSTKPANKDFDYIKSPVIKKSKKIDPLVELKELVRRNSLENEAPFNFQGMLRKTNFKKEVKEDENKIIHHSLKKINRINTDKQISNCENQHNIINNMNKFNSENNEFVEKNVKIVLASGITLEGVEVEI